MAFDFPAIPSIGQTYVVGGITYVWDGVAWNASSAPAQKTAETRNRIRNPAMQVSQENGDVASVANSYYMADQWAASWVSAVGQSGSGRVVANSPNGSKYALHQYVNTADTSLATEWLGILQPIEGLDIADFRWGFANARQAVLRFWAFASSAGTYGGAIRSPAANRTFIFDFTLPANVWTEVVKVIPGDTEATAWPTDNTKAGELWFTWAASAAQCAAPGWNSSGAFGAIGQRNGFDTVANHFYVADVGLYRDPQATGRPPPFEMPAYDDELLACQRYWEWMRFTNRCDFVLGAATLTAGGYMPFLTEKRVTPTVSISNHAGANYSSQTIGQIYAEGASVVWAYTNGTTAISRSIIVVGPANARM